jgi:hypothetical protein
VTAPKRAHRRSGPIGFQRDGNGRPQPPFGESAKKVRIDLVSRIPKSVMNGSSNQVVASM